MNLNSCFSHTVVWPLLCLYGLLYLHHLWYEQGYNAGPDSHRLPTDCLTHRELWGTGEQDTVCYCSKSLLRDHTVYAGNTQFRFVHIHMYMGNTLTTFGLGLLREV